MVSSVSGNCLIELGSLVASSNAEQREIAAEQTYVDTVYERLEESAKVAQSLVAEGFARGHVGNEGGLVERDAMVYQASRRLSALNAAHDGLVFGRLNLLDGESRYIGRIGVRDADREILLVDWRAPGGRRLLPGHRPGPGRRGPPPGAPLLRRPRRRGRGRPARRRQRARRHGRRRRGCAARQPEPGPRQLHALASSPPSRRSRTRPSGRPAAAPRSSAAAPAPARRSSRCTAPPTCSTPTGAASSPAACSWSARPTSS